MRQRILPRAHRPEEVLRDPIQVGPAESFAEKLPGVRTWASVSVQFHDYKGLDRDQLFAPFSAGAVASPTERPTASLSPRFQSNRPRELPRPTEALGDLATP